MNDTTTDAASDGASLISAKVREADLTAFGERIRASAPDPKLRDAPRLALAAIWLKLSDTPTAWAERLLQVTILAWDADRNAWAKPIPISTAPPPPGLCSGSTTSRTRRRRLTTPASGSPRAAKSSRRITCSKSRGI